MADNSDNAMARRLTDAIGRAIAETLNAGEVNESLKSNQIKCKLSLELINIILGDEAHDPTHLNVKLNFDYCSTHLKLRTSWHFL